MLHTEAALLGVGKRVALLPSLASFDPVGGIKLVHHREELFQDELRVTAHEHIRLQHLAFFGWVNVNVHLHGVLAEFAELTGNAVVPTATDRKDQVAFENSLVGVNCTVHAEHAERKFMVSRECAEAKHCAANRSAELFGEFLHLAVCARNHGSVAHEQKRLLGVLEVFCGLFDAFCRSVGRNLVTRKVHLIRERSGAGACSHVLREVNKHRTRTACTCDVESFLHHAREVVRVLHQVRMLDGCKSHTACIAFLESVLAQVRSCRLCREHDDRARIHERCINTCKRVRCTRTASDKSYTDLTGLAGITVSHVGCALFMTAEHNFDAGVEDGIEHRNGRSTGIAENCVDAFTLEAFDNHFGTT